MEISLMEFIDFIIIFTILGLLIYLIVMIINFVLKKSNKSNKSNNKHYQIKDASVYAENSRLHFQVRGSVRFFHDMFLEKEDLERIRKDQSKLP